jgi:Family of unknown function (DUF6519)
MKGDFSRLIFDQRQHFTRVLMQQGRVQLDADWNAQVAMLLHYLQTLAADLIGEHGGVDTAFEVVADTALTENFHIRSGHYYVNGILCENDAQLTYTGQAGYPFSDTPGLEHSKSSLVYLDVWERHISAIEDDSIREVALGWPDTTTRAQVISQVKATNQMPDGTDIPANISPADVADHWERWKAHWQPDHRGRLKARSEDDANQDTNPCITPPEARYRGAENQLYRVEVHRSGVAWDGSPAGKANAATFKWSRDNGSITFPIRRLEGRMIALEYLGRDDRLTLTKDEWVEIVDDTYALRNHGRPLVQVDIVNQMEGTVTLRSDPGVPYTQIRAHHPLLRRWDHQDGEPTHGEPQLANDGALLVQENRWLTLEDGVQVWFEPAPEGQEQHYRSGDYWLIPARTAIGDVEWPKVRNSEGNLVPDARLPHGVDHRYAPLAIISLDGDGKITTAPTDLRRKIEQVGK